MSQKENDYREGQLQDLELEQNEVGAEMALDEKINAIDDIVSSILKKTLETATSEAELRLAQVIVCHNAHKEAAWWVARKYKLELVTSFMLHKKK